MSDLNAIHLFEPGVATGDEHVLLRTSLAVAQNNLIWKLEGLSDDDLRRPMTLTSTNLIGVVKHLTGVTYWYLVGSFGLATDEFVWDWDDEEVWHGGDMWAYPHESPAAILASYRQACDFGLAAIDELGLDAVGKHHSGIAVSMRWMILTVLGDTQRHLGHADIVRENIDGAIGNDRILSNAVADDDYWAMYRRRMTGEISRDEWMDYSRARQG